MDPIENNVTPLFTPSRCPHDWQPVEGWRARYQCSLCEAIGRKRRVLTMDRVGGPLGGPGVTEYRCTFRSNGVRCSARAVARVGRELRCADHCPGGHTKAARKALRHG
jgi:hypothetical protein